MLNNTNDPAERMRIMREVCESECINTILPPCAPLDQALADILNEAMQSNIIDIATSTSISSRAMIIIILLWFSCMHACSL